MRLGRTGGTNGSGGYDMAETTTERRGLFRLGAAGLGLKRHAGAMLDEHRVLPPNRHRRVCCGRCWTAAI